MGFSFAEAAPPSLIDLRDAYDATLQLWRTKDAVVGRMVWKTDKGRDYLCRAYGDAGNGQSLGPRSNETEALYERFRAEKSQTLQQLAETEPDLRRAAAVYVGLGLPVIDSWAAKLFQHLDRDDLLGTQVLVVGTNAMPAYQIEAQIRMPTRIHATRNTDLAWVGRDAHAGAVLWPALRELDPLFRINAERPFQALAKDARELELLAAPSRIGNLAAEPFRPAALPEQEWLLLGTPLRHAVASLNRTPTALVVPDPCYFLLHKAWLSHKLERAPLKATKDMTQARLVWGWLPLMARYPIDRTFLASVPAVLQNALAELQTAPVT